MVATRSFSGRWSALTVVGGLLLALVVPGPGYAAADYVVNSTADVGDLTPGDGVCSTGVMVGTDPECTLRAAVQEANATPATAMAVLLPAGTFTLSVPGRGEDAATTGDLDITAPLTITGAGEAVTVVDGGDLDRIFDVHGDIAVNFAALTIRNGDAGGEATSGGGGGLRSIGGTVTISDAAVTANSAGTAAGTLRCCGGGIANIAGAMTLENVTVSDNVAPGRHGGGIYSTGGTLTLTSSTVRDNRTDACCGGGISNLDGTLIIGSGSRIVGNHADGGSGGGIFHDRGSVTITDSEVVTNTVHGFGGGILADIGRLEVHRSSIDGNAAIEGGGGGIESYGDLVIVDSSVDGNSSQWSGAAGVSAWGTATVLSSTIDDNTMLDGWRGTGLRYEGSEDPPLTVVDSSISRNLAPHSGWGGGVSIARGAAVIVRSRIDENMIGPDVWSWQGGGIFNRSVLEVYDSSVSGNLAGDRGAGVYNEGLLTISGTTVAGNAINSVSPEGEDTRNGGAGLFSIGYASVTNSTISGNDAAGLPGAGVYADVIDADDDPVALDSVTIAGNTGPSTLFHDAGSTGLVTLRNSIVSSGPGGTACVGVVTTLGHNLATDATCTLDDATDLSSTDPLLDALAANGGLGTTHLLLEGSPAIDSGEAANCPPTDQRGVLRPVDGDGDAVATCDRGAIEVAAGDGSGGGGGDGGGGDGGGGDGGGGGEEPPTTVSSLSVTVLAADDTPVVARVDVRDAAGAFLATRFTDDTGSTTPVTGLPEGETVTVTATVLYAPAPTPPTGGTSVALAEGDNEVEVRLEPVATGVLTGTVRTTNDGGLVPATGAFVTATQSDGPLAGRTVSTRTDASGNYSLALPARTTSLAVSHLDSPTHQETVDVLPSGESVVDIVLDPRRTYEVTVDLYTKFLDQPVVGPHEFGNRTWPTYGLRAEVPAGGVIYQASNPMNIRGVPGDEITLCGGGTFGLAPACTRLVLGERLDPSLRLDLQQFATVTGRFVDESGLPVAGPLEASLLEVEPDGRRSVVRRTLQPNPFELTLPHAGDFEIRATAGASAWRTARITATSGVRLSVGDVPPLAGRFSGPGNFVVAQRAPVVPGQSSEIRTSWQVGDTPVAGATLVLDVPPDTSLLPDSVLLDNEPVAYSIADGEISIPLGDLAAGTSGTARHRLLVLESSPIEQVLVGARVRHSASSAGDRVGEALLEVAGVTIVAPTISAVHDVTVSGVAPAGSIVTIHDRTVALVETVASPGGFWRAEVTLPDFGPRFWHDLRATTEHEGRKLRSASAPIQYDPDAATATSVEIRDPSPRDGDTTYVFDPRDGVAAFPIVVNAGGGADLTTSVTFDRPDRVANVLVQAGDQQVIAERDGATFTAQTTEEGAIAVLHDLPATRPLMPYPAPPDLADARAMLPSGYQDFEVTDVSESVEGGVTTVSAQVAFPSLTGGADADIAMTLSEAGPYEPTARDLEIIEQLGLEVYDLQWSLVPTADDLELTLTGLVPASLVQTQAAPAIRTAMRVQALAATGAELVQISIAVTTGSIDAAGATGRGSKYAQIEAMRDALESSGLEADLYNDLIDELDDIVFMAGATDAAAVLLTVGGAVLGTFTAGIGSVAVWGFTYLAGQAIDTSLQYRLDALAAELAALGINVADVQRRLADPVYLHDPSGYVYEAVPSNRLGGVTTSLLFSEDPVGPFEFWNADWYGQANPQTTDVEGRYGWDVPEGYWQVAYEKEGYDRAWSEVLEVLPPHFDVNVPMVSHAAPALADAVAVTTGVTLTFDRYLLPATVDGAITVTHVGSLVDTILEADDAEDDGTGRILASRYELTFDEPLEVGDIISIEVAPGPTTYAGTVLSETMGADVTVTVPPEPPAENHPPTALPDQFTVAAGSTLQVAADAGVLANDVDPDDDPLTAAVSPTSAGPTHGSLALAPDGSVTYSPDAGFIGTDTFTYVADDGRGGVALGSVLIGVTAPPPRWALLAVTQRIDDLRSSSVQHRLDKAVTDLEQANADELWADDAHPDLSTGKHVFGHLLDAIDELGKAIADATADGDDALVQTLDAIVRELVTLARGRANGLLLTATRPDQNGTPASRRLVRAAELLAAGDHAAADGDPEGAVKHYGKVWEEVSKHLAS